MIRGSVVATVNLRPITRNDLDRAARAHLYRQGVDYARASARLRLQARIIALENLIGDETLRQYTRLKRVPVPDGLVERRYAEFVSQFPDQKAFRARLAKQGMTEKALRKEIAEEAHQVLWIESKIATALEVEESEVSAWYEANAEKLRVGEAVRAAHIFLSTVDPEVTGQEERIRKLHSRILEGEKFEDLAADNSDDPRSKKKSGDLGWFTKARVPKDFSDAVFAIPAGHLGDPFRTKLGWHLVKVVAHAPARVPELDEVRAEIRAELANSRRVSAVKELMRSMRSRPRVVYYERAIRADREPEASALRIDNFDAAPEGRIRGEFSGKMIEDSPAGS